LGTHFVVFQQTILEYIVYGMHTYTDMELGFYLLLKRGLSKIYMQDPPLYILLRS
jgi:hypothetical protein